MIKSCTILSKMRVLSSVCYSFILIMIVCASNGASHSINNILTTRSILSSSLPTNLVESITIGAQIAYQHCNDAFKWNRWNCPENAFARRAKQSSTKELGYVKAIMAAGIMHTITKNCSRGEIDGCGCNTHLGDKYTNEILMKSIAQDELNKTQQVKWTWGGCSDDIDYGSQVSQTYLDDLDLSEDPESQIHLHNHRVGREVVRETMIRRCVCHGLSGSCSLQTCWMQAAPFDVIARKLKQKYKHALQVPSESDNSALGSTVIDIPLTNDLVYLEESPNYCKPNNATGWKGTKGRICSRDKSKTTTADERRSCRNLCRSCGHRIKKQTKMVKERCNCSFKWCCEVKCQVCITNIDELTCE